MWIDHRLLGAADYLIGRRDCRHLIRITCRLHASNNRSPQPLLLVQTAHRRPARSKVFVNSLPMAGRAKPVAEFQSKRRPLRVPPPGAAQISFSSLPLFCSSRSQMRSTISNSHTGYYHHIYTCNSRASYSYALATSVTSAQQTGLSKDWTICIK